MKTLNDTLLLTINGWAGNNHFLDMAMVFCAKYLIYLVILAAVGCVGYCAYKREWKPVLYFCISVAMCFIVLKLAGLLNLDHRPFMDHKLTQLISHAPGKSFPSDHTTGSAALALSVLFFTRFKKIGIALLVAACAIGFSRIFVGVHYPLDILGGLLTALAGSGLVVIAKKIVDNKPSQKLAFNTKNN